MSVYQFEAQTISGKQQAFADLKGKVLLIVNTASKCGFTPQYAGLEDLHKAYGDKGLVVMGFPCNQFGHQEPGDESEIQEFCSVNYGVTFPMFAKVDVNGDQAHPLFNYLKSQQRGFITSGIKWNFTKFLINREGEVVGRFAPTDKPEALKAEIEKLL